MFISLQAKKAPAATAEDGAGGSAPAAASSAAPPVKKVLPPAAAKPAKGGAPLAPGALDTFKFKHTPEDADALAVEIVPGEYRTGLDDSAWKIRLQTLEDMTGWIDGAVRDLDAEVVVRFLAKKGWSEKNFQVYAPSLPLNWLSCLSGISEIVWHSRYTCRAVPHFWEIKRSISFWTP